jgi:hypothetical protein
LLLFDGQKGKVCLCMVHHLPPIVAQPSSQMAAQVDTLLLDAHPLDAPAAERAIARLQSRVQMGQQRQQGGGVQDVGSGPEGGNHSHPTSMPPVNETPQQRALAQVCVLLSHCTMLLQSP